MANSEPTAIITGASSGIGRALALRLAKRGYRLVLIARGEAKLREAAKQIGSQTSCDVVPMDLADAGMVQAKAGELASGYGPVRVLVNNGGGGVYEPFMEIDEAAVRQLMQVHYFAAATLMRAVLPGMLEAGTGRIVNVASIAAEVGPWGHGPYAAAKAALIALTQSLAAEYSEKDVRFSYVSPGVIKTAFFDGPGYERMAQTVEQHGIKADRVARAIEKMIDHPKLAVTVPGSYRFLSLIKAISPSLAHRLVAKNSRPES